MVRGSQLLSWLSDDEEEDGCKRKKSRKKKSKKKKKKSKGRGNDKLDNIVSNDIDDSD